ncbi:pseudouridine synthase [Rhizobium sp. CFBP 8762]|uniref:pseudouridine synthase n=1 Tax=Rhizobium sp. CFBP 8762 TaxID=2775279 RepID=UPI00178120A3|nr:pseudouridine synthase [Rhizobium sp. CFBP 8762]MBD8553341.1 pseudouridine synthase [Rhizobium sp. CFBP 8762]
MTFNDKPPARPQGRPKRLGTKFSGSDKKPYSGGGKPKGDRPFKDAERPKSVTPRVSAYAETTDTGKPERISKIMARAGVASRRDIERMIMEGRVKLNGKILDTPVVNATMADKIEVDGEPIRGIERTRLWLYHKPAGLVTTNADPEGRTTVFERLPKDLPRVLSIGRLDINTEGLLLLTNDGGLSRVLELPATGWLRRYRVRAHGEITQEKLDTLKDGIAVDGVLYGGIEATLDRTQGANVWMTMALREGKNREIKNVLGALGLDVNRLIRISYGPFQLGELPEGAVQEIKGRTLRDQLGPRLIEEAKANFDAPLYDNTPDEDAKPAKSEWSPKADKTDRAEPRSFRDKPEDRRERALGRLDTKRDAHAGNRRPDRNSGERGGAGGKAFDAPKFENGPKREPGFRARKANVWMAPGARPIAEKKPKVEGEEAATPVRRERNDTVPRAKRFGRTKDGAPIVRKFDPDRKKSGAPERPDRGPRVIVNRADDGREWIRSTEINREEEAAAERRRGGFGRSEGPRGFGDRPPRSDRPRSEGSRPPRDDSRPPRDGDRPPRREGDKPFGAKSFGDKPRGKPSFGDKPSGDRPFGGKSSGAKSFGGKPSGGKSFGEKPSGGRSGGDKPYGGKPSGGKPSGARGADRRR